MGWNDRLPEDPYIPFESEEDRTAYEEWLHYLESQLADEEQAAGLTSANIELNKRQEVSPEMDAEREAMLQRFVDQFCGKKAEAAPKDGLASNHRND